MPEILICDQCNFCMPYSRDVPETPCPESYPHDWTYPNMIRVVVLAGGILGQEAKRA